MKAEDANKIIENFKKKTLSKGTVGETVLRKKSWLPCSKAKIKYAYFKFIEDYIEREGKLPADLREELVSNYTKLNTFIDDATAEKYAKNYDEWQAKKADPFQRRKAESFIKQYIAFTHMIQSGDIFDEINDFIEEEMKNERK